MKRAVRNFAQHILMSQTFTTATMGLASNETSLEEERIAWEGVLGIVGQPTGDGRYLIPGEIAHRDLPLPFLVQRVSSAGHDGSEVAGRIEQIRFIDPSEFAHADEFGIDPGSLPEKAQIIWGEGTLDDSEAAQGAMRLIENGAGVSLDLPADRIAPFDPDTLEEIDPEQVEIEDVLMGSYLTGIGGKIAAATIVTIPAFEEASVRVGTKQLVSSGALRVRTLTAAAAGLAPLEPPLAWFEYPEPDRPTPLTVTDEGQVYGHLALWNQCHTAFASCERPPRSRTDYAYFHVGQIKTREGELVDVGRITVGDAGSAKGGHASLVLGRKGAMEHYDRTGCVAAFVRASNGKHGIWLCGAVRSDAPAERIRDLRANPPSGDWRDGELVAVLSVPVPGFPIPRTEARLVASGDTEAIPALIASGYSAALDPGRRRVRMRVLRNRMLRALESAPWYWEFRDYPESERKKMAKDGRALPDGSFPIKDCTDAEDAIRSQGRADPEKRAQVRAHIKRRVRALGCEGDIFDKYK
ncbi:MAG: hypothetical protein KatS3mg015_2545 [Fimbriimonadales bacterium]|nr:MAG: hypothetical protein KatS3mg015_2545 [Fimbriimonadales bacterium]